MSAKNSPQVPCRRCAGSGTEPLSIELLETLTVVRRLKSATSADVSARLHWKHSKPAINNRLEDLRALGLLYRKRDGKFYTYTPAK